MINIYEEKDNQKRSRIFLSINKEGEIKSIAIGASYVPDQRGIQFYVDDYVAEQLDKFDISIEGIDPIFKLRKGESLDVSTKEQERRKEIDELERKLKELKGDNVDV